METWNLKKFFLYLLVCSIALSALMGIWAIVSGEFGELQGKILGTTMTVVGTSILGLACGAYFERLGSRASLKLAVPVLGIVLSIVSAGIVLWLIWGGIEWEEGVVFKTLSVSLVFAFSLAQLSLLSLARLARRFHWATVTVYVVVLALASIVSMLIITQAQSDDGLVARLLGVLGVVDAALTVMIPIFHRLSRTEFAGETEAPGDEIDREIAGLKARIEDLERRKARIGAAPAAE